MRAVVAGLISILFLPSRFRRKPLLWKFEFSKRLWSRVDPAIKFVTFLTFAFLLIVFLFSFTSGCSGGSDCQTSGYGYFLKASPNEIGDALAGVSGSLAFLWLILTVFLQGKELSAQRQELRLTRKESAKMAEALQAQVDIFQDERKHRNEQRARETFDELLINLRDHVQLLYGERLEWKYIDPEGDEWSESIEILQGEDADRVIERFCRSVCTVEIHLLQLDNPTEFIQKPEKGYFNAIVLEELNELRKLYPELPRGTKVRFLRIGLRSCARDWKKLISAEHLWKEA